MRQDSKPETRTRMAFWLMGAAIVVAPAASAQTDPASPIAQNNAHAGDVPVTTDAPAITDATSAAGAASLPQTSDADIVVTGSRIRGAGPVGSAVIGVGRADVETSAAISTAELFRNVPQAINIGINETNRGAQGGAGNITYVNSVNLRGIGPNATLTLLDDHRLPGSGTGGTYSDTSVIPLIALQRVEIVADGASAIYGSDAVAGVVNLIMRRDLDGVEASARYGLADKYNTSDLALAVGKVWSTGQVMIAGDTNYHSNLRSLDRPYIRSDLRAFGGSDFRVTNCNPGNITVGGQTYPIPLGGVSGSGAGLVAGTANRCDLGALTDVIPEIKKTNVAVTFSQEITPGIKLIGDAFYYKRTFVRQINATAQTLSVPVTNAYYVQPAGSPRATQTVGYFFGPDLGNTFGFNGSSETYQGTLGAQITLPHRFRLEVTGSYGHNYDEAINYGVNATALTAALGSSNPATAFNPYGTGNNAAVLAAIGHYVSLDAFGAVSQQQYQAKLDGPLASLPGGDLRIAVGGEYDRIALDTATATGPIGATVVGTRVRPGRNFKSAYGELLIPLFGTANALPGLRRLEIDVAGRYDKYSDVGHTTNPKVGVNWSPVSGLLLRGSYGTSFRAPNLTSLTSNNPSLTVQTYADPLSATGTTTGYAWSEGNPDLKPETARTFSFGADIKPDAIPGLSLSGNYFNVVYRGQVTSVLGDLTVLQRSSLFSNLIYRNPSAAFVQSLTSRLAIRGVPLTNVTLIVDARPSNLGVTSTDGFDFVGNYHIDTAHAGRFGAGINGIYYFTYKVAQTPSAPILERLGYINYPTRYSLRGNVNWTRGALAANVFVNHVPSYRNDTVTPVQSVSSWTTVDADLAFDLSKAVSTPWLKGFRLDINVQNLFDRDPPFVNIGASANQSGGFDVQQANPLGRLVTFGLTTKF